MKTPCRAAALLSLVRFVAGCSDPSSSPQDSSADSTVFADATDALAIDAPGTDARTDVALPDVPTTDTATSDVISTGRATIVFQCAGLAGGICTMNADGTGRQMLVATGRAPDRNAAGEILFHDDSYNVQHRGADGSISSLGAGAFPRWASGVAIVFQCNGLGGGICTMNADGTGRQMLVATGRTPDRNTAGEILFHDDSYNVQLRHTDGSVVMLGAGAFPRWAPGGGVVFQCSGLGGGICMMNADGTARQTLVSSGRSPDRNTAGEILFHDDSYAVQLRRTDGSLNALGAGAFARWSP